MLKPVRVVDTHDESKFEDECQALIGQGYGLVTASCGFVQSAEYDFCASYQAVFALPGAVTHSPCADRELGQPDWCSAATHCIYRDADGTCMHPKGSYPCAIPPL